MFRVVHVPGEVVSIVVQAAVEVRVGRQDAGLQDVAQKVDVQLRCVTVRLDETIM